jgi:hypothetical protein
MRHYKKPSLHILQIAARQRLLAGSGSVEIKGVGGDDVMPVVEGEW